jgi:hypothetical protein
VANVKWLTRIKIIDSRFQGRFMARDNVSIREEQRGTQTVWTFSNGGRARDPVERATATATSSPHPRTPTSPAEERSGRTTDRSLVAC